MSNDLISRKAVLEALQKEDLEFMQQSDLQTIIRNCVNTIPTAYDVDKVVEQICGCDGCSGCCNCHEEEKMLECEEYARIYGIVKAGGVDE